PRPRKPPTPTRTARPPVERACGAWLLVRGSRPGCLAGYGLAVSSHQVPLAVLVADVHADGTTRTHVARVPVQGFATVGDLDGSVAAVHGPQHCRVDSVAGARRHFGREGRWPGFDAVVDAAPAVGIAFQEVQRAPGSVHQVRTRRPRGRGGDRVGVGAVDAALRRHLAGAFYGPAGGAARPGAGRRRGSTLVAGDVVRCGLPDIVGIDVVGRVLRAPGEHRKHK